jgi:molybdate transport system substrate-binding protein
MEYSAWSCLYLLPRNAHREADMKVTRRGWIAGALGLAMAVLLPWGPLQMPAQAQGGGDVIVFAAASLKNALDAIAAQWQKETGKKAVMSYAASSALAKQIEQAAPAQIFISADLDWMDYVAQRSLIRAETRSNLLGNRIVLIAPKDGAQTIEIKPGFDLAKVLGDGRLAMANVDAVPAGKYGKAALEKLGVWAGVSSKVAQAENVRAALLLVSRGEAPAGIVYQTDAAADPNVRIIGTFPEDIHPPIIYPIALTASATNPDAAAFFTYIKSGKAKPTFEAQGFTVLGPGQS